MRQKTERQKTIEELRTELAGRRKPFLADGKPMIYPIRGEVFVFPDNSGIAYLDGDSHQAYLANSDGKLPGTIATRNGWYLVPVVSRNNGDLVVTDVRTCSQPSVYRFVSPETADIQPGIWGGPYE